MKTFNNVRIIEQFNKQGWWTIIFFQDGKSVGQTTGVPTEDIVLAMFKFDEPKKAGK